MNNELLLIDLSSIAHPIWHMSQSEPDPNATSTKTVDRVRSLASQHPHAAVCCDSGRSFRYDIDPTYKAQRPAQEAPLHHQIALAREQLVRDGFPVWAAKGYEADDLIASATAQALAIPDTSVLIASADKDLLQLVSDRVKAKSLRDGAVIDAEAVKAKFAVGPEQMLDYLALVGDASDNIIGAKGIGPKKAADLLNTFGSLDEVYKAIDSGAGVFPVSVRASLVDFRERMPTVRNLITLRTDVEIPFSEIAAERTPVAEDTMPEDLIAVADEVADPKESAMADLMEAQIKRREQEASVNMRPVHVAPPPPRPTQEIAVRAVEVLAPAPTEWERQLEPRSIEQAKDIATAMYNARLFNGYGSAPAVLSTIMAGRELGLHAVASLRGFHIVEGRHALAADLIRGLVLRSGLASYFRCSERTPLRATFVTHRKGDPEPISLTYTIEEGRAAFSGDESKWSKSGWGKNPADMLVARAGSKLARLVYPEVVFGLYSKEELE